jgi:aminopeptidase YwaD
MAQDIPLQENLKKHLAYLASDKLGGRLTGSKNEKRAAKYIQKEFKAYGLTPKGTKNSWFQQFEFSKTIAYGRNNSLVINANKYTPDSNFYPLPFSADARLTGKIIDMDYGIEAPNLSYTNYSKSVTMEGKIFLINLSFPDGNSPHSKYEEYAGWRSRYRMAMKYKPSAIIFYKSEEALNIESFKKFNNISREDIPLIHVSEVIAKSLKADQGKDIKLTINLVRKKSKGENVIGYIDNGAATTVIIGAHYDHLGQNEYDNSLYRGKAAIHNGADDNASGTSALIELAGIIKKSGIKGHNYIFTAFSGEELGLLGSSYFTKNPTIPLDKADYMFNMDMIGRLDSARLIVNGIGTSKTWDSVIYKVTPAKFKLKTTLSGMGPSDQSSFYLKNIPALHFFTGAHGDYHKPSDDADKINYAGLADIVGYIDGLVVELDKHPKLVFQKTKDDTTSGQKKIKVTLGIIPDYIYDKGGLRVDGVSDGRPAQKAGIMVGDIIEKLGEYTIKDMSGYMDALGKFNKGEKTEVVIKRAAKEIKLPIEF